MLAHLRPALVALAGFTLVTGIVYPLAVTGGAALLLPRQAGGSLAVDAGRAVGSDLIGQGFSRPEYLHGRPSAAGDKGYDATASGGSNYGPLDPKLAERVTASAADLRKDAPGVVIPSDAVTASASGLDPDISPAFARLQAPRIAKARGVTPASVQALIDRNTAGRTFGLLGEPRVDVLAVNRALDRALPKT
jgi:K+-transporting ATPase ATPase C chain